MDRKEQLLIAEKLLRKIADRGTYFSKDEVFFFWQDENVELKYQGPILNRLTCNGLVDEFGAGFLINGKGEKAINRGLEKFLDNENEPTSSTINLHIGDKGNVQKNYGTIGESMNQVSDSDDSFIKLNKATSTNAKPTKNSISTNILYPLTVGAILIIIALILKYGFGITY